MGKTTKELSRRKLLGSGAAAPATPEFKIGSDQDPALQKRP